MAARKKLTRSRADVEKALKRIEKAHKDLQLHLKKIRASYEDFYYFIGGYQVKPRRVRPKKGR